MQSMQGQLWIGDQLLDIAPSWWKPSDLEKQKTKCSTHQSVEML